jgi:hypothetical protein
VILLSLLRGEFIIKMRKQYFFRNDDVRGKLDESLVTIQELFIKRNVPITHAVEPANITSDVVNWLISKKKNYPNLITIIQHGYDHSIKNTRTRGEFGGDRTYSEQYEDIRIGKELMNSKFGDSWFRAFSFPYSSYNKATIKALQVLDYKVLNSQYKIDWKRQLFYAIGQFLGKGLFFDRHVSWNMRKYPGTTVYEISINISFIKRYINEEDSCEFAIYSELCKSIDLYFNSPHPIGLLLHHRYHINKERIQLIAMVLDYLEEKGAIPVSLEGIYRNLEAGIGTK